MVLHPVDPAEVVAWRKVNTSVPTTLCPRAASLDCKGKSSHDCTVKFQVSSRKHLPSCDSKRCVRKAYSKLSPLPIKYTMAGSHRPSPCTSHPGR